MPSTKEIRTQIGSIKSTQKITSAMEMVAASKMRKAQERMEVGRPYARRIRAVAAHLSNATQIYRHPYLTPREVKRVGYIIVSTDRGLCGGLNINTFKKALESMNEWHDKGIDVDLCLIGNKAASFFNNVGGNVVGVTRDLGETPSLMDVVGTVKVMLDAYLNGKIDQLMLVGNEFVNTMTQKPVAQQLLPLQLDDENVSHRWDYIYEPAPEDLVEDLMNRYVESQVFQMLVENRACEQAARMVAMKAATDNAGDLIGELQLAYNKARQAAITQELAEICSGAAAV